MKPIGRTSEPEWIRFVALALADRLQRGRLLGCCRHCLGGHDDVLVG
jgi:hypothetical protein